MSHFQRGAGADACFLKRLRGLSVAPQAACPAHTLPTEAQCPSGLSTLCPPSAAPTPSNRDQFLKTEHYYLRGRRVPPSAHTGRARSLGPASFLLGSLTSPLWAGVPSMATVTRPRVGSPASTRAVAAILPLPTQSPSSRLLGWEPGMEPPPRLWKSRFSLCPWEAARWRGEDGAFSFV